MQAFSSLKSRGQALTSLLMISYTDVDVEEMYERKKNDSQVPTIYLFIYLLISYTEYRTDRKTNSGECGPLPAFITHQAINRSTGRFRYVIEINYGQTASRSSISIDLHLSARRRGAVTT